MQVPSRCSSPVTYVKLYLHFNHLQDPQTQHVLEQNSSSSSSSELWYLVNGILIDQDVTQDSIPSY